MAENRVHAKELAKEHKEISVAEFFEKNKHLLGYENLQKSLLTVIRECVDNAIDACEETRALPDIFVQIKPLENEKFQVVVEDNGPGIVKKNIPKVFAKLLYGSKFHRLKQARGQQGIGVSGAVLYAQLTTGRPVKIYSRVGDGKTHIYELHIDTVKNEPEIVKEEEVYGDGHGTRIEMVIKGKYVRGKQSVPEYIKESAIMNPHAKIIYVDPEDKKFEYPRVIEKLPKESKEIKPHPSGIEFGILLRMLKNTKARNLIGFLTTEFSRIGRDTANKICTVAGVEGKISPKSITRDEAEKLLDAMQTAKLQNPPTDCLSSMGAKAIEEGMKKELKPEFVSSVSRSPSVYRGRPFQIEVGIAYGGELDPEGSVALMRFANKVPLLYEQSSCALTKSVIGTDWRRYKLSQSSNSLPVGPVAFLIHMASVWVPYTSEGKEAIAAYPAVLKEIKLALQEAARKLGLYLGKRRRAGEQAMKKRVFEQYMIEVADALEGLTGAKKEEVIKKMKKILEERVDLTEFEDIDLEKEEKKEEKPKEDIEESVDKIFKEDKNNVNGEEE